MLSRLHRLDRHGKLRHGFSTPRLATLPQPATLADDIRSRCHHGVIDDRYRGTNILLARRGDLSAIESCFCSSSSRRSNGFWSIRPPGIWYSPAIHPFERWLALPGPRGWLPAVMFVFAVPCFPIWVSFHSSVIGDLLAGLTGTKGLAEWRHHSRLGRGRFTGNHIRCAARWLRGAGTSPANNRSWRCSSQLRSRCSCSNRIGGSC